MTALSPTPQNDALHAACASASIWKIKDLLRDGADPDGYNEDEETPLSVALKSGRHDVYNVVESLLAYGADVNKTCGPEEEFPLNLVMKHVPADTAELVALRLIQDGADPDLRDKTLRNSYDYALDKRYVQVAKVVEDELSVNEAVHKLLDIRLEIDSRQLILAIQQGRKDDVDRCLARGADVNHIDANGAGPIHYLIALSPLVKIETLDFLLRVGADVNLLTYEGDSALNLAIKNSSLRWNGEMMEIVNALLMRGARADFRDLDGKDAYDLAEENGYLDVLDRLHNIFPSKEALLQNPPIDPFQLVDLEYIDHWEALMRRITTSHPDEFIEFITDARINVDEKVDEEGNTCIHLCALRDDAESIPVLVGVLVRQGANINAQNNKGETPLHLAAMRGSVPIVKCILQQRAQDSIEDNGGKTAEERALYKKYFDVVKTLKLHGQKRNSAIYGDLPEAPIETLERLQTIAEQSMDSKGGEAKTREKNKNKKSSSCSIL